MSNFTLKKPNKNIKQRAQTHRSITRLVYLGKIIKHPQLTRNRCKLVQENLGAHRWLSALNTLPKRSHKNGSNHRRNNNPANRPTKPI
jgi:hypothetical protein